MTTNKAIVGGGSAALLPFLLDLLRPIIATAPDAVERPIETIVSGLLAFAIVYLSPANAPPS